MRSICLFYFLVLLLDPSANAMTEVFFSPQGGCENKVVELIDSSKSKIDAAIYSLNNKAVVTALYRAKSRGVKIRILEDRVQAGGKGNRATTLGLKTDGFDIRLHSKNRIQHNKFAIFDSSKVITGSFNWTNPAETSNEENCVTIDDKTTVTAFQSRFEEHLWKINTEEASLKIVERLKEK